MTLIQYIGRIQTEAGARTLIAAVVAAHNRKYGEPTMRIRRFATLNEQQCMETGELATNGEINRKILLTRSRNLVVALYDMEKQPW
jgi:hypothetical protein